MKEWENHHLETIRRVFRKRIINGCYKEMVKVCQGTGHLQAQSISLQTLFSGVSHMLGHTLLLSYIPSLKNAGYDGERTLSGKHQLNYLFEVSHQDGPNQNHVSWCITLSTYNHLYGIPAKNSGGDISQAPVEGNSTKQLADTQTNQHKDGPGEHILMPSK